MSTPKIMDLIDPIIDEQLNYPTAFPNQDFDPDDPEVVPEYLKVSYIEARGETHTFGKQRVPSILQIDFCIRSGEGVRPDIDVVGEILDLFAWNTTFENTEAKVYIDNAPTVGPSFNSKGWHITPISISYEVYR